MAETETRTNRHPGRCVECGGRVGADEGLMDRVEQDGGYRWARLRHRECPGEGAGSSDVPVWAVPTYGKTPLGNMAHGLALVEAHQRPAGAYPASDSARALERQQPAGDPHVAAQWIAYQQWRGLSRPEHGLTMDQMADVLDGADLEHMDRQVAEGRRQILGAMR